jgi:ABC-2 type transport system permease protein
MTSRLTSAAEPLVAAAASPSDEASVVRACSWLAAWSLGKREIVRFFRQRNRIVGAVGTPILFWVLFGAGLTPSFRPTETLGPGQSFREYYFPGSLVLIVLFTAIFTTISVIEDRREGFLQSVLVAPVSRWAMVLGKVWGGAAIALAQALIFLPVALTFHSGTDLANWLQLILLLLAAAVALTSLGFVFAWNMESTQGFHAIMNLVLMPMWLLSGAFFPAPALHTEATFSDMAIHWAVRLNPLSYAVGGVRRLLFGPVEWEGYWMPSLPMAWSVTLLFAAIMFAAACLASGRRTSGDLL